MTPELFVISSMALTHGVAIGIAVRELILLRRHRAGDDGRDRLPPPIPAPRPTGGEPIRKPLPACLVPVRHKPARVLEDA